MFNEFRTLMLGALKDYNEQNNLGYTDAQLDDLFWQGTTRSKQFNAHFAELAKANGTTKQEEIDKWSARISAIAYKYSEWTEKK